MFSQILGVIVLAVPLLASLIFAFVPERRERPVAHKRWRIGFVVGALIYTAIVFYQQRLVNNESDRKQAELQRQIEKIGKNTEQPPKVTVNMPPPLPGKAYIYELGRSLEGYQVGQPLAVATWFSNAGESLARNVGGISMAYVIKSKPLGLHKEPMLAGADQERAYRRFLSAIKTKHGATTLVKGDKRFGTAYGPVLDETLDAEIKSGAKEILVIAQYQWTDETGNHATESCAWLQAGFAMQQQVWHSCEQHNAPKF